MEEQVGASLKKEDKENENRSSIVVELESSKTPESKIMESENIVTTENEPNNKVLSDPEKEEKLIETIVKPLLGESEEETMFRVIYNKNKYDVSFPLSLTVIKLKSHLQNIIGVPQELQKVMFKGLAKDDRTLKELGVTKGSKIMVVGSKLDDVLAVSTHCTADTTAESTASNTKEPLCKQKMHRKVLDKGIPDDVMPGIRNLKENLPQYPLTGLLNKASGKVRLTFKLELDQLWIGSKERTEKIPMTSIKLIVSEPIENHEEYHILALQLGPTEASRYWVYWVPAQYVDAIKDAILGAWSM